MKILAVSDHPSDYLWGPGVTRGLREVDLILSCGDLPPEYLEYLVTFTSAPLVYVPGNHDGRREQREPEGCLCADGALLTVKGLRIVGLGGSIRYNGESRHQYTQGQMELRALQLAGAIRRAGGFDLLLTHSAAFGLGDGADPAHVGFRAFCRLLDRWQPSYLVHGHSHLNYDVGRQRVCRYGGTQVINAYERYLFDTGL